MTRPSFCHPAAGGSTRPRFAASSPTRTSSATLSRRTCSRAAPTFARCRRCSGTSASARPRSTRTSRGDTSEMPMTSLTLVPSDAPPAGFALARFVSFLEATRAPRTARSYGSDLTQLAAWLDGPPATASASDLQAWIDEALLAGLSPSTLRRRAAAARAFYDHLLDCGERSDNPALGLDLPHARRSLPRPLGQATAARLIETARGTRPPELRDRALLELLYGAGLRVSEAARLRTR